MEETEGTREKTHHYYFEDGTELYVPYWVESATSGSFDRRWEYNWNQLKTRWVPLVFTTGRYLTPEPVEPISGHVIMDNYSVYSERKRNDDAVFLRSDNEKLRRKRTLCTCFFIVVGLLFVAAFLIPVLYTILSPVDTEKRELLGQYSMEVKIINLKYVPEMGYTSSPIFRQVASLLEKEIDYLYMHRSLNKSYYWCNVTGLRNGSVIAKYDLYFRKEEGKLPPHDAVKSTLYTAERDEENKTLGKLGEYRFIIDFSNVQGVNIVLRKNVDATKRSFWADVTQRHVESTYIPTKSPTRVPQTKSPSIQGSDQATRTKSLTISTTKNSANAYTIQSHKISISEVPITKSSTTVPTTNNPKETLIRKSSSLLASSKSTRKDLTANKRTEVSKNEVSHEAGLARNSESSVVENQTEKPTTASETKLSTKDPPYLQISVIPMSTSATFNTTTKILIEIPKSEQSLDYIKTETLTLSTTTKEKTSGPTATPNLKTITEDVSSARTISESTIELSTSSVSPRYLARSTSSDTLTMNSPTTESIIEDVLPSETLAVPLGLKIFTSVLEASFLTLETQKTPQISSKIPVRISSQVVIASVGSNTISAWLVEETHSSKKSEILVTATSSATQASWSVEETNLHTTFLVNNTNTFFRRNDKDSSIQISEDHLKEIFPQFTENVPLHVEKLYSSGSTATKLLHSSMPDIFSSQYKNVLQQDISPPITIPFPAHVSSLSDKEYYSRSVLGNVEYSSITGTFPSVQPSSILPHFHIVESAPLFTRELVGKGTSRSTVTKALSPSRTNRLLSLRRTLISKDHFADNAPVTSPESSLTESLYLSNSALAKRWRTSSKDTSPSVYNISHLQNVSLKLASTMQDVSYASRLTVTETLSSYWKNIFPAVYYTPPIQDSYFVKSTIFVPESTKTETKYTPRTTGIEMPYVVGTNVATSVADSYLIKDTSTGESTPSVKDIMKLHLESTEKNTFLKSSLIEGPFPASPSMTIVSSLEETKLSSQTYSNKISIFSMSMGYSHPTETYSVIENKSAGTETMFESGKATSPSTAMSLDSNIIIGKDWISYSSEREPFTTYYPDIMSGLAYSADFHPSTKRFISDSRDIGIDATVLHTGIFVASEDTMSSSFEWSESRDIGLDYASSVLMFPPTVPLSTYNVPDLTLRGMHDKHAIDTVAGQKQTGNSVIMNITEAVELLKNKSNKTHELLLKNSDMTVRLSSISIDYYYDRESLQSSSHLLLLPVDFGQQLGTMSSQLHSSVIQNETGFTVIQASILQQYIPSSTNINSLGYLLSSSNNMHMESDYLMQSLSPFPLTGETSFYLGSYWTSDGFQSSNNDFIHIDSSPSDASRSPGSLLAAYNNNATRIRSLNTTVDIIPTRSDWKVVEFSNGDSIQSSYMANIGGDMYYSSIALNTFVFSPASIYNDHKDDKLSFLDTSAPSKGHSLGQKPKWSELIRPTTSKSFSSHMTTMKRQSSLSDLHISSNLYISKSSQWFTDSIVSIIPQAADPLSDVSWDAASVHTYMMVESFLLPHGTDTPAIKKSNTYNYESRSLIDYETKSPVFLMPWSIAKEQDFYPLTETTAPSLATPWNNPVHPDVTDFLIGNESSLTNRYAIPAGLSTVSEEYITVLNRLETLISASPRKLDAPLAITDSAYSWSSVRDKRIYDSSSYENVISSASLQTRITAPETNLIDSLSDLWFVGTLESSVTGPTLLSQTASSSLQPNASISWEDAWEAWTFDSNMETPISVTSMPNTYATKASDTFISYPMTEIWSDWLFTSSSLILVSSDVPFVTSLVKSTSTISLMSDSSSDSLTTKNFYSIPSEPLKPVVVYLPTSKTNLSVSLTSDQWADIWSEYLYDSMSIASTPASGFSVAYTTPNTSVPLSTDIWEEDIWSGWIMNSVSINPSSEFGTILTSKTLNKSASHHGNLSANILNDLTFNSLSINPTSAAVVSATPTLLNISNSLTTDPLSKMWNNWTLTLGTLGTDIGMTTGGSLGQDANDIGMGPIPSWIANILGEWAIETLLDQATSAISPSETARWTRGSESSVLPGDSLQESLTTRSKMMANSTPVITFDEYNSSIIIGENARIACSAINVPGWSRADVMRFPSYRHRKAELIGVITSDGTLAPGVVKNVMLNKSILYTDSFTIVMDFNHVECADEGTYMVRVFSVDTVVLEDRSKVSVQGKPSAKLSLPAEVVSGRWLLGITCKADLGYPPGRVIFQMKGLGQKEFVEFVSEYEVTNTTEITGCLTSVTYKFDDSFQPNHEWNLTTFRCAVIDTPALPPGSNMAASNEEILQFLPSDVCNWYPGLRYIPHPFDDCKRYISCPSLYILSCDPGKCFDKSSSICIQATDKQQMTTSLLTGTTSNFNEPEKEGLPNIRFTKNAYSLYIGEIENISCTIENMRGWKTIRISRLSSRSEVEGVATVTWPEGTVVDGFFQHVSLSENSMATESGASLIVQFKNVQCSDPGTYTCTVEGDQGVMGSSNASVAVLGKPSAALFLPTEIVEGRWVLGVRCAANIGYPPGRVIWLKRGPNQKEFTTFLTKYRMYNTTTTEGCLTQVTYTFDDNFSPNVEWDFTELKCAVIDTPAIHDQSGLVVSNTETLQFVPANACDGVSMGTSLIQHPYSTCELYINCPSLYVLQCPAGKCFDTASQTCVLK